MLIQVTGVPLIEAQMEVSLTDSENYSFYFSMQ